MKSTIVGTLAALALFATAMPAAAAQPSVQVGRLSCEVAGGIGLIVGSQKAVSCTFHRANGDTETYSGEITRIGLDIGKTDRTRIEWLVFAATDTSYTSGALGGKYVGASGEATLGVGLGGNVLVGGLDRSFALQPFSVQAQTGLSLAAGLAELTLR
ncbi:MAG: DUF992 domain-containing protein [Alphaproteobacteria bacterium]|nr:DUF992 domain-containing protein [Alphaproteobacteria bacterium]